MSPIESRVVKLRVGILAVVVVLSAVAASAASFAQDGGDFAMISSTLGVHANRLCIGAGLRVGDIGCPSYAPSVTTAGDVSVTGNISANMFIGDGSGLTGITDADRIVSGTTSVVAHEDMSIAFTTAGSQRMVIDANGRVGISTTNPMATLDVGAGLITGGTNSATRRTYLNMSAASWAAVVDLVFPGGSSSSHRGLFRAAQDNVLGTNDIFFQLLPLTTAGYGYLEAYNAAGLIVGTGANGGTTAPILFMPNKVERARMTTTGMFGIGTSAPSAIVHVSGSLMVARNDNLPCGPGMEGLIRRDATNGRMEVCE